MNVSIVNYTHEGKESISISLQRTSDLDSRIILAPVDARITIIDNVCKGSLSTICIIIVLSVYVSFRE